MYEFRKVDEVFKFDDQCYVDNSSNQYDQKIRVDFVFEQKPGNQQKHIGIKDCHQKDAKEELSPPEFIRNIYSPRKGRKKE